MSGCNHADVYDNLGKPVDKKCPFCRPPLSTTDEEIIETLEKRMEVGDEHAFASMGYYHALGDCGLPQNSTKAVKMWHKAGKLLDMLILAMLL